MPEPPSVAPTPRSFPGQPPPGHVYYGASIPKSRSLPAWEAALGSTLALHRSFFKPDDDETAQLIHVCRDDLARGRMPHVSFKPTWTWEDIATGGHDEWLGSLLRALGEENAPLFLTLHHEPENDAGPRGRQPADYVAMQRRVIALASELAPLVTITPVYQQWTFDPLRDDIDPSVWMVPEAAAIGIDLYNPWSQANGKEWRSFGSKADELTPWVGDKPVVIGEYGCHEDPRNPGLAAEWLRDAADYARTHNIVSMSYFNSGADSPDGTYALRGDTQQAFAELLASDWVARPG
jgi:hypothetical protein